MARHAEVTEQEIIDAALALEQRGKRPNPGAIRKALGDRGGLARIKSIWQRYCDNRDDPLYDSSQDSLTLDSLPNTYAENVQTLIGKVTHAMEHMAIAAYHDAQQLFERRLKSLEATHEQALEHYKESERSADECVQKLESELDELQVELDGLAQQNAKLLIENAEMRGKLEAAKG
ncbi:hypothetical protein IDSA_06745 [Pseudidiomarina salinarum]|uniref:KfrA N-terminal DNA-binding domain-containing protein n=1 Tax=Pseudidiomarina salinarum TaxID=435908 RepID=A0A094IYA4_9GAMM|nr:DNA-binding protein [Pseudidiomarina salinarum]KFZ30784.1 hypothetical protein IDSA_06745 [Pseudidiomarina salinarum]RUO71251.1 hypothetical protein CWI79_07435 [Pseudidiomarina salinarum]